MKDWGAKDIESILEANNIGKSLQECIHALEKTPESRTEKDVLAIRSEVEPVIKKNELLSEQCKDFSSDDFKFISERLRFEFYNDRERVFGAGELGDKFYIIIQGSAGVLVPNTKKRGEVRRDK